MEPGSGMGGKACKKIFVEIENRFLPSIVLGLARTSRPRCHPHARFVISWVGRGSQTKVNTLTWFGCFLFGLRCFRFIYFLYIHDGLFYHHFEDVEVNVCDVLYREA